MSRGMTKSARRHVLDSELGPHATSAEGMCAGALMQAAPFREVATQEVIDEVADRQKNLKEIR